jgi:hypothetical protein
MTFTTSPQAGLLPLESRAMPKPSLNQLWTEASSSRASVRLPCCSDKRLRLTAARCS